MPECDACGGHVSQRFARVFSVDGTIDGCPECASNRELFGGTFASEDGE